MPIVPKIRNLNFNVIRNGASLNQLTYLYNAGVLNGVNPASFDNVPNYKDTTVSLEKRARAYLDINCAHCHSDKGFAAVQTPRFGYEHSLQNSKITEIKRRIKRKLENGQMPKIGTTVIDEEGVSLIKKFIDGL
jgi:glutaredoxin